MARKSFETAEDIRGIGGENVAGKAADGLIGFQKFGMRTSDGFFVRGNDAVIATGERAGPGFVGAELFVVVENLARQREQGPEGFALGKAGGFEHLYARFFESKHQAGGKSTGCVVERFFFGGDVDGYTAEGTRDGASNADGGYVAFDCKDFSFERWDADTVEGLERVHRSGERSIGAHRFHGGGVTGAAGMENDFSAELLSADAGKLGGRFGNLVIGDAYQDGFGGESVVGDSGEGTPGVDKFGGFAGSSFGIRRDGENVPAAFVQEAAQRASYASGTENGQGLRHPC